jgi:hypothetical protein
MKFDHRNSVAIKISSFADVEVMKKLNEIQYFLSILENCLIKYKNLTYDELISKLKRKKIVHNLSSNDFDIIKNKFKEVKPFELSISALLKSKDRETLQVVRHALGLRRREMRVFREYDIEVNQRLSKVFNYALDRNCHIMVDAEQSYLQFYIDSVTAYNFLKYNSGNKCILGHTVQCYLRRAPENLTKWYNYVRHNNLNWGIKLVRGAYMNEEREISHTKGTKSPVCDDINSVHINYNKAVEFIMKHLKPGDKVNIFLKIKVLLGFTQH